MTPNLDNPSRRRIIAASMLSMISPLLTNSLMAADNRFGIRGQQAPELEVSYWIDANGEPTNFNLTNSAGKWVFLKCFQNWCPGCHSHGFPTLQQVSDELAENPRVVVAGIQTTFEGFSTNTKDKVRELQLKYDLRIPMGHDSGDPDGDHRPSTMRNYRTGGTPWMILIDPDRTVVFNDYGLDGSKLIAFLNEKTV